MVLNLSRAQKGIWWAFEKVFFQFFPKFWVTKLKPFSGKVRQTIQSYINQILVIGNFLENGFEATLSWKMNLLSWKSMFWVFEIVIFQFFPKLWGTNLKPFSEKVKQSIQNCLNQNLVTGSFLENGFEATLNSKRTVVNVWKGHFSVLLHFWVTKLKLFSEKVRQSV